MKFNVYKIIRILFYCALLFEIVICSATAAESESESEGRFLLSMKAGFLKKKKIVPVTHITKILKSAPATHPTVQIKKSQPQLQKSQKFEQPINLMQKSESLIKKSTAKAATKTLVNTSVKAKATQKVQDQDISQNYHDRFTKMQDVSDNPNDPAPLDLDIGMGPLWVAGWIKYFKYYPSMKTNKLTPETTPRQFMINPQYNEQYKLHPNFDKKLQNKNEFGKMTNVFIHDKNSFYAKLHKNQLFILTSREVKIKRNFFFNLFFINFNFFRLT